MELRPRRGRARGGWGLIGEDHAVAGHRDDRLARGRVGVDRPPRAHEWVGDDPARGHLWPRRGHGLPLPVVGLDVEVRGSLHDLLPGLPVDVRHRWTREELEVVHAGGEAGAELTVRAARVPRADEVLRAHLVLREHHVDRPQQAGGRRQERDAAGEVPKRRTPDGREIRPVAVPAAGVGLKRVVVPASVRPEARRAVGVQDVAEAVVRDGAYLRSLPAARAGHVRRSDHRGAGHALADDRKQVDVEDRHLHRARPHAPIGGVGVVRRVAGALDRVQARVAV